MAQVESKADDAGEELGDVTEMLGQLDTNELNELSDMLQGVNDGLGLAQTNSSTTGTATKADNLGEAWSKELYDNYF